MGPPESKVDSTTSAVESAKVELPLNSVSPITKIALKPNEELKSPFMLKSHLLFSRPDPKILHELYKLTCPDIPDESADQKVWVSSNHPSFPIKLKLKDIQKTVKHGGLMDTDCLSLAVRNMAREDAENFKNTNCLGWRHYVDSDWIQFANSNDPKVLKDSYCRGSTMYDASGSHLVFIPVITHNGHLVKEREVINGDHWSLYAFNMCDQKISILDSLPDVGEGGQDPEERHKGIREVVYGALREIMDLPSDFVSWKCEFPKVPRQQNGCDCGFFVFNYMRFWDGHKLVRSFSTETMELRKDFLAYILSCKNNDAVPPNIYELIQKLPVSEVQLTTGTVQNARPVEPPPDGVSPITNKIVVKPNKDLKSPFLVKRHLLFLRPDPNLLDKLYELTSDDQEPKGKVWVSSNSSFRINLTLGDMQETIKPKGLMGTNCLNLAVRNMAREDGENFKNTKCLGWRHYVNCLDLDDCMVPSLAKSSFSNRYIPYDASQSHVVFIPVRYIGHWSLYAFNMCDQKLYILDSQRDDSEGGNDPMERHMRIRYDVCVSLNNLTMDSAVNFLTWDYEFPKLPRQQRSYDSGFFVFNFMRLWDGSRLVRWFSTETTELRKDFLAYILSFKNNNNKGMPTKVSECIRQLPGEAMMMNLELLKAARKGQVDFGNLFTCSAQKEAGSLPQPNHNNVGCGDESNKGTHNSHVCVCIYQGPPSTSSDVPNEQENQSAPVNGANTLSSWKENGGPVGDPAPPTAPASSSIPRLLRGVTAEGSGVLHIAAGFGRVEPVKNILEDQHGKAIAASLLQAENNLGDRPLHLAVATESTELVKFIVTKAREIMAPDTFAWFLRAKNLYGQTCLHIAVSLGHRKLVAYLLSEDAAIVLDRSHPLPLVQIVDNEDVSPLYLATTLQRVDVVQVLTRKASDEPDTASYSGPGGKTALHAAVLLTKDLSNTLVNWNPSLINIPDEFGSTPLHYLAVGFFGKRLRLPFSKLKNTRETHFTAVTKLLLEKDPSSGYCEDSEGSLPIHIAAANGILGIIKQFMDMCPGCELQCNASGQNILHIAAQMGEYHVVRRVCSDAQRFRMILNMKDNDGNTPLHLAIQKGCSKTSGILLGHKNVSLSIKNNDGHTHLDLALLNRTSGLNYWQSDSEWICNSLLAAGAGFGIFRADHFSDKIPEPGEVDSEALSETVSKSAGVMAACAALLFNATLNIFLNVEAVYSKKTDNTATQDKLIRLVKKLSEQTLSFSACAILLFAIAGFPILPSVIGRTLALITGLGVLIFVSMNSMEALAARLSLAEVPGAGMVVFFIFFLVLWVALCTTLMWKILQHARPLWARYGPLGFVLFMFGPYDRSRSRPRLLAPLLHVWALMEALGLTCFVLKTGVRIVIKYWR